MAKEIILPKFGFTLEESTIVKWLKQEGDPIEKGEPICEVTTDKINMEVESPADGFLGGVLYGEGETVQVTEIIAWVLQEGEEVPKLPDKPAAPAPATEASEAAPVSAPTPISNGPVSVTPVARRMAEAEGVDLSTVAGSGPGGKITRQDIEQHVSAAPQAGGKVRATPAARRLASERGFDLAAIAGSGPRGRVQAEDVAAYVPQTPTTTAVPSATPQYPVPVGEASIIPLEGMRLTIANRMQQSYQEAPHVFFNLDIDMTEAIRLRKFANAQIPEGQTKVSMTAIILKACAWALRQHPIFNSYLQDNQIYLLPDVNVGMAVALDDGLIVPVIKQADQKGVKQIGEEVVDLATRAREARLRPDDVMDGTFTVSNLGMFGIHHFTAVINSPQVAILAVGAIEKRFVPDENDQPIVKPLMTVTLSADHRVIDGALAAQFVSTIREALEQPSRILL